MNPRFTPAAISYCLIRKSIIHAGIFLLLIAILGIPIFSVSSASPMKRSLRDSIMGGVRGVDSTRVSFDAPLKDLDGRQLVGPTSGSSLRALLLMPQFPAGPPAPNPEVITIFQSNCTTPATEFNLGDTVCAKITGSPFGPTVQRRLAFVNSTNFVLAKADIVSNGQTLLFTLPTASTTDLGGLTVDNRGNWTVAAISASDESVRASDFFVVKDPQQLVANLAIFKHVPGNDQIAVGGSVPFTISVSNLGPNAATNVEVTDEVPSGTTFVSEAQLSGPAFACVNPTAGGTGTTTCTIASLARGEVAVFRLVYELNPGTSVGTEILNTANVSSETTERHTPDNTSEASAKVVAAGAGGGGETCTVNCPEDINRQANTTDQNGNPGALVHFTAPSGNDECGTINVNHCNDCFFPVGTTVVSATASTGDACSFTVTVTAPGGGPTITCPANQTVTAAAGACDATVSPGTPTTTGTGVVVTGERNDGQALTDPYPGGPTIIVWTATDSQDRTATCQQTIIVNLNDTINPTIEAPPDVNTTTSLTAVGGCGVVIGETELGTPNANDNCSVNVTRTGVPAGNFFPVGTTTITYVATDASGNTATDTQLVIVADGPPVIFAPEDATYSCANQVPAADPSQATGPDVIVNGVPQPGPPADSCSSVTVTVADSSSSDLQTHTLTILRTFTATDTSGHSASAVQTITVIDTTAPTISLNGPSSVTVECHTSYTELGASASDNCDGTFAATASGNVDVNTVGTYTVTYSATDSLGNSATPVTRTVNVVDTTKPVITLAGSSPMTVECHTSFTDPGASASDSCDANVPVTASGSVNPNVVGTYILTYNASDDSGNAAIPVTRTVNVVDTTAPTITLTGYAPSAWPPNHKYQTFQLTSFVSGASDSCDTSLGSSAVVIEKVTSDEIENGNGDGNTLNDIIIAADCKSVQLRREREGGGDGRVYTITFKVTDASGNVGRATATVGVPPNSGGTAVDSGAHYTVNGTCP